MTLQLTGSSTARGPGQPLQSGPGKIGVVTTTWPRFVVLPENFHQLVVVAPAYLLGTRVDDTADTINRVLPASPIVGLLTNRVRYLVEHAAGLDLAASRLACDQLVELLAAAVEPDVDNRSDQLRQSIRREVDRRLADPALCGQQVADHLNISLRYLQRLLATEGTSFHRLLAERRVQRACAAFDADPTRTRTVAQIALQYGFTDPTRFSKVFTRHTGISPRAYRSSVG